MIIVLGFVKYFLLLKVSLFSKLYGFISDILTFEDDRNSKLKNKYYEDYKTVLSLSNYLPQKQ